MMTGSTTFAVSSPPAPPTPAYNDCVKPRSLGVNHRAMPPAMPTYTAAAAKPFNTLQIFSSVYVLLVEKPQSVAAMPSTPAETVLRLPHLSEATPHGICPSA